MLNHGNEESVFRLKVFECGYRNAGADEGTKVESYLATLYNCPLRDYYLLKCPSSAKPRKA
jgi:hypothetical protein